MKKVNIFWSEAMYTSYLNKIFVFGHCGISPLCVCFDKLNADSSNGKKSFLKTKSLQKLHECDSYQALSICKFFSEFCIL